MDIFTIIIPVSTIKKFFGIGGRGWRSAGSGGRGGRIFRNNYLNFKKLVNVKKIRAPSQIFFLLPLRGALISWLTVILPTLNIIKIKFDLIMSYP